MEVDSHRKLRLLGRGPLGLMSNFASPAVTGPRSDVGPTVRRRRLGRVVTWLLAVLVGSTFGCGVFPDEFNLSPLYRHRVGPDGQLSELDVFWPLFHWQRDEAGTTDFRIRPLYRTVSAAPAVTTGTTRRRFDEFLAPLGYYRDDGVESVLHLIPLFYYREHYELGDPARWDRDWWITPLIWGGSTWDNKNYFAFIPFYGEFRDWLFYTRFGFFLFPLYVWTRKEKPDGEIISGDLFLWPLIGWGGSNRPHKPYWWRILPFFGYSIHPVPDYKRTDPNKEYGNQSEFYTLLWPFFHWGGDKLDTKFPTSEFSFFPLFGWKVGGPIRTFSFLWPFFRYAYKDESLGPEAGQGDYLSMSLPWPIFRIRHNTWKGEDEHMTWFWPLFGAAWSKTFDKLSLLWPIGWFRKYEDELSVRKDNYIIPLYWDWETRWKKTQREPGEEVSPVRKVVFLEGTSKGFRLLPLVGYREERSGQWEFKTLAPWPFEGRNDGGVEEAWDWLWTLWRSEGDGKGNVRTRGPAHLWSSREYAGKRFQASVPFLFNFESEANGRKTLRLLQFFPIRWGGPATGDE